MRISSNMYFRLFSMAALLQPILLFSVALPSLPESTSETLKVQQKAAAQAEKVKDALVEAKLKEEEAAAKAKAAKLATEEKAKKAAEEAKIKEAEVKLKEEEALAAWHKRHPTPPSPKSPTPALAPPSPPPPSPAPAPTPPAPPSPVPPIPPNTPNVSGVPMFPGSIFNADISSMPVDPNSAGWLSNISSTGAAGAYLYRGFGACEGNNNTIFGEPINVVGPSQPMVQFTCNEYCDESDAGPFPMPANGAVEGSKCPGGPKNIAGGDVHSNVLQTGTTGVTNLWELYNTTENGDGSWNGFLASWNTLSNQMRPAGWTSTGAGGTPILPLLVKYEEVAAGAINHAIYCSINWTNNQYIWPASHKVSGVGANPAYPPLGACLRLKANYDISGFNANCQVVLKALKKYGCYVLDLNGGDIQCTLWGAYSPNWPLWGSPDSMQYVSQVTLNNFDYVDVSSLMVSPTSYEAASGSTTGQSIGSDTGSGGGTSGIQIQSHHTQSAPRKN